MIASSRPLIVYIHGFQSSPLSEKAEETRQYLLQKKLDIDFIALELSNYPGEALQQLRRLLSAQALRPVGLIGSSLGGFMATALAQEFGVRAVLVNPAVYADKLIVEFLGAQQNPYTGKHYDLCEHDIEDLQKMTVQQINNPDGLLILLQMGDETLDYRLAVRYYQGCRQLVEEGGNHRFQNYASHLPDIIKFLALTKIVAL